MQRDPLVDPPEYLYWQPDAASVAAWDATLAAHPARAARIAQCTEAQHRCFYADLLRARLEDQALARWVRQGHIAKAWLATGEEAATIGPVHALDRARDHLLPVIRNQGALSAWGLPAEEPFRVALGSADARNAGRDLHAGDPARRCWPPVSMVGTMIPVAVGLALAEQRRRSGAVVLAWVGDGATKTGAAHEGLNLAGVLRVPLVVIIQANGVALGTRTAVQHGPADFRAWPAMYGLHDGGAFDGNHLLDAYAAVADAVAHARAGGGPVLLEAQTFRFGGHATHDAAEARQLHEPAVWAAWGARDPIGCYETWLQARTALSAADLAAIECDVRQGVEAAAQRVLHAQLHDTSLTAATRGVDATARDARRRANVRASGRDQ